MTNRLKRCPKCRRYTINPVNCSVCETDLENIHPPKFSLQDKYQDYRIGFFKEKMQKKYPDLLTNAENS